MAAISKSAIASYDPLSVAAAARSSIASYDPLSVAAAAWAASDESSNAISFAGQRRGSSDWASAVAEETVADEIDADSARYAALGEWYLARWEAAAEASAARYEGPNISEERP